MIQFKHSASFATNLHPSKPDDSNIINNTISFISSKLNFRFMDKILHSNVDDPLLLLALLRTNVDKLV